MSQSKHENIALSSLNLLQPAIGSGSTATILNAIWNGQQVAIKKLKPTAKNGSVKFDNELSIISKFENQHPNIIKIFGQTDLPDSSRPALVMEYMERKDLIDYLFTKVPTVRNWSYTDKPLEIARDIAQGLMYLHSLGILHKDLKPENILINSIEQAKIADFGEAYELKDSDLKGVQQSFFTSGTVTYLAPECTKARLTNYKEQSQYSKASDVYALGLLLLTLLILKTPYFDIDFDDDAILKKIAQGEIEGIDKVPPYLKPIFNNLWNMDPETRPDVQEVINRLDTQLSI